MGDVDEVFMYANAGVLEWMDTTEKGAWIRDNNIKVEVRDNFIANHYARTIDVYAEFEDKQYTMYILKYGDK